MNISLAAADMKQAVTVNTTTACQWKLDVVYRRFDVTVRGVRKIWSGRPDHPAYAISSKYVLVTISASV
jgi:hypothetical protein